MSTNWRKHVFHGVWNLGDNNELEKEMLWHVAVLGQKSLIIEAPNEFPGWRHRAAISSLIDEADVEQYTFAHLEQGGNGRWSLIFTDSRPPALRCSLWAPLIDEREIHILEWITGAVKLGIWKGQEVIVKVGTSPIIDENEEIAAQSEAYRFLQGGDLTPKFLGHLYRQGVIIGFVLEALVGRHPHCSRDDREACYAAVQKLFATGTLHSDLNHGAMIITKEGVRFVDIVMGAIHPADARDFAIECVDDVFDGEMASCNMTADQNWSTPPRGWPEGTEPDWEDHRRGDIEWYGECPPLPPITKIYLSRESSQWCQVPLVPYTAEAFKPWDISEVGWPSTLEGRMTTPASTIYRQFLKPEYLSLQLPFIPPGELPRPGLFRPIPSFGMGHPPVQSDRGNGRHRPDDT